MTDRSHPGCWNAEKQGYIHTCQKPTGRMCARKFCERAAGTLWGPHFCPEHDVERLDGISRSVESISVSIHMRSEDS